MNCRNQYSRQLAHVVTACNHDQEILLMAFSVASWFPLQEVQPEGNCHVNMNFRLQLREREQEINDLEMKLERVSWQGEGVSQVVNISVLCSDDCLVVEYPVLL